MDENHHIIDFKSRAHFFSYISDEFVSPEKPLNIFVLLPNEKLDINSVCQIAKRKKMHFEITSEGDAILTLELGVRSKQIEGYLLKFDKFWVLMTFNNAPKARQSLISFLRHFSSLLSLGYVPSTKLLDFINLMKEKYEKITLHESFLMTEDDTYRRWRKKHRNLTGKLLSQMKKERGKWVAITFKAHVEHIRKFHVRIYEDGQITFYSGDFADFYSSVLMPFSEYCREIKNGFSDKQREVKGDKIILHPITFSLRKYLSKSDLQSLSKCMLEHYSVGVLASGNPLLIMTVIDNNDGSAFDVYAKDKKIEVVPLMKSSSSSLGGLCKVITDFVPDVKFDVNIG